MAEKPIAFPRDLDDEILRELILADVASKILGSSLIALIEGLFATKTLPLLPYGNVWIVGGLTT